jgi:hypothetical protein
VFRAHEGGAQQMSHIWEKQADQFIVDLKRRYKYNILDISTPTHNFSHVHLTTPTRNIRNTTYITPTHQYTTPHHGYTHTTPWIATLRNIRHNTTPLTITQCPATQCDNTTRRIAQNHTEPRATPTLGPNTAAYSP